MAENKRMLDVEMIDGANKKYEKTKDVPLQVEVTNEDGEIEKQEAIVEIDVTFSPTKIKSCVREFIDKMDYLRKIRALDDSIQELYLLFIVIKHFSSLQLPQTYKAQIQSIEKMLNNDLLFPIYAEFEPTELEKISIELKESVEMIDKGMDEFYKNADKSLLENVGLLENDED